MALFKKTGSKSKGMGTGSKARTNTFLLSVVFATLALIGVAVILNQIQSTATYYELNKNVSARTKITEDMLSPREVTQGGEPTGAFTKEMVASGNVYAKFDLNQGDILTRSNSGPLNNTVRDIPDDFTIATMPVQPTYANMGQIKRGDYINIFTISNGGGDVRAQLAMQNILVYQVKGEEDNSTTTTTDAEGKKSTVVATEIKVVLKQDDVVKLAAIIGSGDKIYITPTPASGTVESEVSSTYDDVMSGVPSDSGKGTDPSFPEFKEKKTTGSKKHNSTTDSDKKTSKPSSSPSASEEPGTDSSSGGDGYDDLF